MSWSSGPEGSRRGGGDGQKRWQWYQETAQDFFHRLQSESTLIRITSTLRHLVRTRHNSYLGPHLITEGWLSWSRADTGHTKDFNKVWNLTTCSRSSSTDLVPKSPLQTPPCFYALGLYTIEIVPWNHVWTTCFILVQRESFVTTLLLYKENSP